MWSFGKKKKEIDDVLGKVALYKPVTGWFILDRIFIPQEEAVEKASSFDDLVSAIVFNKKGKITFMNKDAKSSYLIKSLSIVPWLK